MRDIIVESVSLESNGTRRTKRRSSFFPQTTFRWYSHQTNLIVSSMLGIGAWVGKELKGTLRVPWTFSGSMLKEKCSAEDVETG